AIEIVLRRRIDDVGLINCEETAVREDDVVRARGGELIEIVLRIRRAERAGAHEIGSVECGDDVPLDDVRAAKFDVTDPEREFVARDGWGGRGRNRSGRRAAGRLRWIVGCWRGLRRSGGVVRG